MFIFVALKKIIPILLLSIYIFGATSFSQLLRIHHFVIHYQEHKQHNQQISFADFFIIHYVNEPIKDADYDKDMQLPFKSNDGCINTNVAPFIPTSYSTEINRPVYIHSNNFTLLYDVAINSFFLSNIWQPPKNC